MRRRPTSLAVALALLVPATALPSAAAAGGPSGGRAGPAEAAPPKADVPGRTVVRFATYNVSLNRASAGELRADLLAGDAQARAVAEVVQRTRPEVLLLNELDHDPEALRIFVEDYLGVPQGGAEAISYPYTFTGEVNTGVPSGVDLDGDGAVGGPGDALGFGAFPGQYGMAVLSQHPVVEDAVRTFQDFRWADMPGARLPDDPGTPERGDFYSPEALEVLPLSSKSHWDVPVRVGQRDVHLLVSHPTPPTFDGPEDRNGLRNADEIRFWADYISPARSQYVYDDEGGRGGLRGGALFVVAGDLNADPEDGDSVPGAIDQLLKAPRVNDNAVPESRGGLEQALLQGGANLEHTGSATTDTADFSEPPGNLRVDYVLPRIGMRITGSGVFWPLQEDPLFGLVGTYPFPTSDHRLVWVDATVPGAGRRGPRG
ncbi:endonuclease/exonuclease/phosphatase family protein [uncultured Pseudokineococcus sp.]|uniref:endonuclease/exonuclease/phosphatase family protein n=1 Tax=uncultured Pseudokineococcus sp. TaxID=1642928 RepID=UPI002621455E|nr:endonuclease/exonuclease/phosphatase family protein [uncultured Pseudokineococcus sp.]